LSHRLPALDGLRSLEAAAAATGNEVVSMGAQTSVVLLAHPGVAGCREHHGLVRQLRDVA
jgi:hypothetical protein